MNNKKRTSLKTLILLPVFILGALTIICNVMAINNIRTVNSNAADITDNCMMSVSDLGEIKNDIQVIHTLGLSQLCYVLRLYSLSLLYLLCRYLLQRMY